MGTYTQLEVKELGLAVDRLPALTHGHLQRETNGHGITEKEQLAKLNETWGQLSEEVRLAIMKLLGQAGQA